MDNLGSMGIGVVLGMAIKGAGEIKNLTKDFSALENALSKTKIGIKGFEKQLGQLKLNSNITEKLKTQREGIKNEFLNLKTLITGGLIGKTMGSAISFESAMADVRKVVNFDAGDDIKKLSNDILKMTRILPASAEELAAIAAAGGQIGLGSKEVREFTVLVTKMKTAFEMSAEEVGESVAKIKNILGLSIKDMEDLGDSINYLSDNSASRAKEIIEVIKRAGAAGKQIGFTKEQIAALSSTFISLGKGPEVAGTAINSLYRVLSTADTMGAKASAAFQKLGMSGDFLKTMTYEKPQEALDLFLERIAKLEKTEQMGVLVGIFGREYSDDIATLVQGLQTYKDALKNANDEAKRNSLEREFTIRSATAENAIKKMKGSMSELITRVGMDFLEPTAKLAETIQGFFIKINEFAEESPAAITKIMGVVMGFLALKPAFLILRFSFSYVVSTFYMFYNLLLYSQMAFKIFTTSCTLANIALKAKTLTTTIYAGTLKALGFVLGGLSKVFKLLAVGIRVLSVAMMSNPIGLILGGIALVAGYVITHWDEVKAWFMSFIEWLRPVWEPIYRVVKGVFEGCAAVFVSFKNMIMPIIAPIVELFNAAWQSIGDFFYNIFGGMFDWLGEKLSWVGDAISSVSGFVSDALGFVGLGDKEEKTTPPKQEKSLITQTLAQKSLQPPSPSPSFSTGTVNVSVNGTFNIATENGSFNMKEFALAVEKSVLLALKKQEQNRANTTIYG